MIPGAQKHFSPPSPNAHLKLVLGATGGNMGGDGKDGSADGGGDGDEGGGGRSSTKRVATPADRNSTNTKKTKTTNTKLTVETSTLLSYLHHHDDDEVSWRGVLEDYFATAKFSSLASFIAKER